MDKTAILMISDVLEEEDDDDIEMLAHDFKTCNLFNAAIFKEHVIMSQKTKKNENL
jgi:hypothetical protein